MIKIKIELTGNHIYPSQKVTDAGLLLLMLAPFSSSHVALEAIDLYSLTALYNKFQ